MKKKDFLSMECIGKTIEIVSSPQPTLCGIKGIIRNETKTAFVVETPKGLKQVSKYENIFAIAGFTIAGNDIIKRPEDRLRMKL